MSVRVADYALTEDFTYYSNGWGGDSKVLPQGSWVKPISLCYVPKEVKESKRWVDFNKETEIFVYCHYGIIAIPKNIVREK